MTGNLLDCGSFHDRNVSNPKGFATVGNLLRLQSFSRPQRVKHGVARLNILAYASSTTSHMQTDQLGDAESLDLRSPNRAVWDQYIS